MIIFVEDKPEKKNVDPNIPFVGTRSYKRLLEWIFKMNLNINDVQICNITNFKEYRWGGKFYVDDTIWVDILPEDKIIVLGNEAEKRLKKTGLKFFKLPHPSGSNLQNNDLQFIYRELKKCREFINET